MSSKCCSKGPTRRERSSASALRDLDVFALLRSRVELARTADAHRGIRDHLLPMRNPTDGPRDREHHREHRARNAERRVDDAGVEIDVRVELAGDEILVFERSLFETQRELEQRIVRLAEF